MQFKPKACIAHIHSQAYWLHISISWMADALGIHWQSQLGSSINHIPQQQVAHKAVRAIPKQLAHRQSASQRERRFTTPGVYAFQSDPGITWINHQNSFRMARLSAGMRTDFTRSTRACTRELARTCSSAVKVQDVTASKVAAWLEC